MCRNKRVMYKPGRNLAQTLLKDETTEEIQEPNTDIVPVPAPDMGIGPKQAVETNRHQCVHLVLVASRAGG